MVRRPASRVELVALRRSVPDLAVLVDDADELLDTPLESALKQLAALVDRDAGLIVGGADADALSVQYRGLAVELARHRTGVLLGPASTAESDLFGVRVPVDRAACPVAATSFGAGSRLPCRWPPAIRCRSGD